MSNCDNELNVLDTLLAYQKLSMDDEKHQTIVKDKTMLQFLAYNLDSSEEEVVRVALDTLVFLAKNPKNFYSLKSTFGILEALKCLEERTDLNVKLTKTGHDLLLKLERESLVIGPQTKSKAPMETISDRANKSPSKVLTYHVFGLNEDTRNDLEHFLIRLNGVISVVVDVEHQRCTVRASDPLTPESLAEKIFINTDLEAHLIVRNKHNQEMLMDVLPSLSPVPRTPRKSDYPDGDLPPYLSEEDSPIKEKAVMSLSQLKSSAASWVRTATDFFQNSFYW